MATSAHTCCDECSRPMAKARLVRNGKALCDTCSLRIPYAPCGKCGKQTRMLNDQGEPLCKVCRALNRTCVRCGKPVRKAGRLVDGGAVCGPCAKYYREPQACDQRGAMEKVLTGLQTEHHLGVGRGLGDRLGCDLRNLAGALRAIDGNGHESS